MWYQAAAEQGSASAMTELGAHLRLGNGVAWNEAQAMQWFAKAAVNLRLRLN
jgi:TPR repeat protein